MCWFLWSLTQEKIGSRRDVICGYGFKKLAVKEKKSTIHFSKWDGGKKGRVVNQEKGLGKESSSSLCWKSIPYLLELTLLYHSERSVCDYLFLFFAFIQINTTTGEVVQKLKRKHITNFPYAAENTMLSLWQNKTPGSEQKEKNL